MKGFQMNGQAGRLFLWSIILFGMVVGCADDPPKSTESLPSPSTRTPAPPATSTPTPKLGLSPGTYQVGIDVQPGVHAGKVGTGILDSCYWERLSGVSGEFDDLIANDNAIGQFYVEILSTDKYFKVDCDIIPLNPNPPKDTEGRREDRGRGATGGMAWAPLG